MRIGIIGASSQVGSSLAFYFKHFTDVEPVCFVRSSYSKIFFDISGISCDQADINNKEVLQRSFADLDGVIDCTYPSAQLYEMPSLIEKNLGSIISALPSGKFFIYMSTIMAFGMPTEFKTVRNFTIPQTTYAFIKRKAEKATTKFCNRFSVRGFNFRLGQVHGFLQSVNTSYREKMKWGAPITLDAKPDDPVNIIFIGVLADAIIKAAKSEITPGSYSLVHEPQWSLSELYGFYKKYYNTDNKLVYLPRNLSGSIFQKIKTAGSNSARKWRPLLESYFLMRRENFYKKVKGNYRRKEVKSSISSSVTEYTDFHLIGKNPGNLISGLPSSFDEVYNHEKAMEQLYNEYLVQAFRSIEK